ncbi:uncharacterized protein [Clytia hemisphaerica]|uniref:uncharacterized protein n=1 Tax=Clytia hemisphaerica TaxID=252671 RepID=UPI0034D57B27
MLDLKQRRTLVFFFDVMARTHARKFTNEELSSLEEDMKIALALLERDCSIYLANITTHILRHLTTKIRDNGPLYAFWMYAYERMNSWITRRVMSRSKMEECIMETVQILDWVLFSQFMGKFQHLHDRDNNLCSLSNIMLHQEGVIENIDKGKECNLTQAQKDLYRTNEMSGKRYKKFEPSFDNIEDQVPYKVGEYCYCLLREKFVQIIDMIKIGDNLHAEIAVFESIKDPETGLYYGSNVSLEKDAVLIENLSRPIIVAVEDNYIWFVGYETSEEFSWFHEHLKL